MNVTEYSRITNKLILGQDDIDSNGRQSLQWLFGIDLTSDTDRYLDDAYKFTGHRNEDDLTKAFIAFNVNLDKNMADIKNANKAVINQDWTIDLLRYHCRQQLTIPVPPHDFPSDTVTAKSFERALNQRRIYCALRDHDVMSDFTYDLSDLKMIASGSYGSGYQVNYFHGQKNKGVLVKIFFDNGKYDKTSAYLLYHELLAGVLINGIIAVCQNFTYFYGYTNNMTNCQYLLNETRPVRSGSSSGDVVVCENPSRSYYVVGEFVINSKPLHKWLKERFKSMNTDEDLDTMISVYVQLIGAISYLANTLRAIHGDIHTNNILIQQLKQPITLTYYLPNGNAFEVTTNYVVRVIDYGFMSFPHPKSKHYITHIHSIYTELFLPVQDLYQISRDMLTYAYYYAKNKRGLYISNMLTNVILQVIYGRKATPDRKNAMMLADSTIEELNTVIPNYGGYSDVDASTPLFFEDVIVTINEMLGQNKYVDHFGAGKTYRPKIDPVTLRRMNDKDFTFLNDWRGIWHKYKAIIDEQKRAVDHSSAKEFVDFFNSDAYKTFATAIQENDTGKLGAKTFNDIVRPMMIARMESLAINEPTYIDAVRAFEDDLALYYNILGKGKAKDLINTFFTSTGLILPE